MAAPSGRSGSETEPEKCQEIDVFSDRFDPLRALYDNNVQLPCPDTEAFENIGKFQDNLNRLVDHGIMKPLTYQSPGALVSSGPAVPEGERESVPTAEPSSSHTQKVKQVLRKQRTVLDMMEDAEGPLSILKWAKDNRKKVRVCTRTFKGLRGICIGYVEAFDKFLNLAMVDVNEVHRKPPLGKTVYHQETLTFTKLLSQFNRSYRAPSVPEQSKRIHNRRERKMRLQRRLNAEGVFIEDYHPPPKTPDPTGETHLDQTAGKMEKEEMSICPRSRGTAADSGTMEEAVQSGDNEADSKSGGERTDNQRGQTRVTSDSTSGPANRQKKQSQRFAEEASRDKNVSGKRSIHDRGKPRHAGESTSSEHRGRGDHSSTSVPKQSGKDPIPLDQFHHRHVRQLFIKGDSIVLVSVKRYRKQGPVLAGKTWMRDPTGGQILLSEHEEEGAKSQE